MTILIDGYGSGAAGISFWWQYRPGAMTWVTSGTALCLKSGSPRVQAALKTPGTTEPNPPPSSAETFGFSDVIQSVFHLLVAKRNTAT